MKGIKIIGIAKDGKKVLIQTKYGVTTYKLKELKEWLKCIEE